MSKDILVVPDCHAHPKHNNNRADWLGQYIKDTRPDVVVNMGDTFDMPSLSSFDKGKASFHGSSYEKDINSGLDFLDRMWNPIRVAKKKKPYSVFILVLLGRELWVLSQAYTKTTKARGLATSIISGGVVLCDYETLKTESMIQSLSHLARYGGNMGHD